LINSAAIDERSVSPTEASDLMFALERDQRRLHLRAEEVHRVLLAIEIDDKIDEILELGLGHELAQDRLLRLAGRAPGGMDHDAEDYIVGSAEEASRQHPLALVIHLPADQLPAQGLPDVREAIHNYFAYRRDQESRRLRLLFRDGRIALLIGLSFLFCCVLLRELAFSFGNDSASDIFGEGMLIIGWVAMWRPLEIFLYEWVPIRRRCRILAKLAEMPVIVQSKRIG
jgi:hypothetical protein